MKTTDIAIIQSLLTRFYDGTTTPAEERRLAEFFRSADVPRELEPDRRLFLQLSQLAAAPEPENLENELTAFVARLAAADVAPSAEAPSKPSLTHLPRRKTPPKTWLRAAAAVTLLLALGGGMLTYQHRTDPFRDTCATPEEAAVQIRKANEIINRSFAQLSQALPQAVRMSEYTITNTK